MKYIQQYYFNFYHLNYLYFNYVILIISGNLPPCTIMCRLGSRALQYVNRFWHYCLIYSYYNSDSACSWRGLSLDNKVVTKFMYIYVWTCTFNIFSVYAQSLSFFIWKLFPCLLLYEKKNRSVPSLHLHFYLIAI